jgi:putative DNA methylase
MTRPQTLIEDWLPFDTIGAESLRERGASSALPPLYFLHVWWARRPLTISRAAIVASLLPSWEELSNGASGKGPVSEALPTEEAYRAWFLRLLGIYGDPVAAQKLIQASKEGRITLTQNPYEHDRAFTVNPAPEDLALLEELLAQTWASGQELPLHDVVVLDPFAGGGSIPFEARRYGLAAVANELNPVAAVILQATLDYPARFGLSLAADIRKWGREWASRARKKLAPYFPKAGGENIFAYLWARTVACPVTGKPVPLSPNWWLSKGKDPAAARLRADPAWDEPRFEIAAGEAIDFDPDEGTVSRGVGRSPWTGDPIDGDYIKAEAQAGRMGQMLYAVALKRRGGFDFRAPAEEDLCAVRAAEAELARLRPLWEGQDLISAEPIGISNYDRGHRLYGIYNWADFFSPRQLLAMGVFVQTLREVTAELRRHARDERTMDEGRAGAVETYLGVMLDKIVIYNNRVCRFDPTRGIRSVFDRHGFAFVWSHGEFDASANLLPWAISQIADSYKEMAELLALPHASLGGTRLERGPLSTLQGSAADLSVLPDASVHCIVTDPPYYDNVMYAELSDFFYVWLKRTAGHLYPQWFVAQLTDKDEEAVANPARFKGLGSREVRALAERDYERKMGAAFREMRRVLRDDGVLTVMFTHKRVEAWDTLASALIGAGFSVQSSWPVHTESEHSLHQAKKNAARSTILLACRKRAPSPGSFSGSEGEQVWWDDLAPRVRQVAREKAAEFAGRGIGGVDLYLSTFGPVLAVISERWPVLTREVDERTGQPRPLRPETALDLARQEVFALRKRGLTGGVEVRFDEVTDWYLGAWDAFQAERFPADEARKLAIAVGVNVERDLVARRVVTKRGSDVALLLPRQRRARGRVDPEAEQFDTWLDAAHTAMLAYEEDGAAACEAFLRRAGLRTDSTFKACLQAMINAVPRTKTKDRFVRPEADLLERLRAAFFEELAVPAEGEVVAQPEQMRLDM